MPSVDGLVSVVSRMAISFSTVRLGAKCSGDVLIAGREDTTTAPAFLTSLKIPQAGRIPLSPEKSHASKKVAKFMA